MGSVHSKVLVVQHKLGLVWPLEAEGDQPTLKSLYWVSYLSVKHIITVFVWLLWNSQLLYNKQITCKILRNLKPVFLKLGAHLSNCSFFKFQYLSMQKCLHPSRLKHITRGISAALSHFCSLLVIWQCATMHHTLKLTQTKVHGQRNKSRKPVNWWILSGKGRQRSRHGYKGRPLTLPKPALETEMNVCMLVLLMLTESCRRW